MKRFFQELSMLFSGSLDDVQYGRESKRRRDVPMLAIVILAFVAIVPRACSAVDSRFLDSVERIESGFNPHAIGDKGKAKGVFQFWRGTWDDCSNIRRAKGLKVYPYSSATNAYISRLYAGTWLRYLESRLTRDLGKRPTEPQLFAAWNLGYRGFSRRGLILKNTPKITQKNISKL